MKPAYSDPIPSVDRILVKPETRPLAYYRSIFKPIIESDKDREGKSGMKAFRDNVHFGQKQVVS